MIFDDDKEVIRLRLTENETLVVQEDSMSLVWRVEGGQ
jgi:hypothetical protein